MKTTKQDIIEKIIAAVYPSNPDMSGDQRKKLPSNILRRVESAAQDILKELGIENN